MNCLVFVIFTSKPIWDGLGLGLRFGLGLGFGLGSGLVFFLIKQNYQEFTVRSYLKNKMNSSSPVNT